MGRKLFRPKIGEGEVAHQISRGGILSEFRDRFFFQALGELGRLVGILNLPVAERVHEVEL